jgi:putative hemolysin
MLAALLPETPAWVWIALAGLLLCSALFSAAETALFSLGSLGSRGAGGPDALGRVGNALIARPRDLLVTVLLGNLAVDMGFFALATRLLPGDRGAGDLAVSLGALGAVVVLGEIAPKVVGLRLAVPVARLGAPPLYALVQVLGPLRRGLIALLEATCRALGSAARDERRLTGEDLARVLERSSARGELGDLEADLLAEIVELESIRVREIMTPRVDALFLDASGENRGAALGEALRTKQTWVVLVDGHPDRVLGRVRVRDLVSQPAKPLGELAEPILFVPEVASCAALLAALREARAAEAVVVDEWGGTAGTVTIEAVFEELVGDLRTEDEPRPRVALPVGEGWYRVAGDLSIRDWNEQFGYRVVPNEFETVGGFVTALLGRIPRSGDSVRSGGLLLRVHETRGRRVTSVDLCVDAKPSHDNAPGSEVSA